MQRPEVVETCTVGLPDKVYGEEVVAFVVLRPGKLVGANDILRHCAAALPAFKAPKRIVLREALPKPNAASSTARRWWNYMDSRGGALSF